MDNKRCRRAVKAQLHQSLQAMPMPKPSNKPDLDVEDAEKPKAGESTKTAELVKAALSKALLARAAEQAARRSKSMAHGLEELGSRAIVPRDVKSSMGQEIAKLRTQADVFAGGGKAIAPKATRAKTMRATSEQVKRQLADRDVTRASRVPAVRADDATRLKAAPVQEATRPGVVPQPLEPTRADVVPQTVGAGPMPAPVQAPAPPPPPPSAQAGQTFIGNAPQPSAAAEATRIAGPVAPAPMTPERVQSLRAANPQAFTPAPAPRPMTMGRSALLLGSTGLAGAMMNRPMAQPQQQAAY